MSYSKDFVYRDPTETWGPTGDWFASEFRPDGLVQWPCAHGVEHPGSLNLQGDPLPSMGGFSWGRAKHIDIVAYGVRATGQAFCIVKCIQCIAESRDIPFDPPADFPC